jgi:hypothetical protein
MLDKIPKADALDTAMNNNVKRLLGHPGHPHKRSTASVFICDAAAVCGHCGPRPICSYQLSKKEIQKT